MRFACYVKTQMFRISTSALLRDEARGLRGPWPLPTLQKKNQVCLLASFMRYTLWTTFPSISFAFLLRFLHPPTLPHGFFFLPIIIIPFDFPM